MTESKGANLVDNFGIASLIIVLGVCLSWVILKQTSVSQTVAVPQIPEFAWSVSTNSALDLADATLLDKAEAAFAAGNIALPEGDSALFYYTEAIVADPADSAAVEGLSRTITYLLGSAESAIFRNDWAGANRIAEQILVADAGNAGATALLERVDRYQQIESLTTEAARYMAQGRLSVPKNRNAVDTYRKILRMDKNNAAALQGIAMVAQRLIGSAQTAALAGDVKEAEAIVERVAEFAPGAPGLKETGRLADQWDQMSANRSLQSELLAASKALREDRLVAPKDNNALSLFQKVLADDPNSEAAKRGITLVAQELITRSWTLLRDQDLAGATKALADAEKAGAAKPALQELRDEMAHQNVIANARLGRVELALPISRLEVIRQPAPIFPKRAANAKLEGWAEVQFLVSPTGDVLEPEVRKSSDSIFDRAALDAISTWRFEPYMKDGRAVPIRTGVKFTFRR